MASSTRSKTNYVRGRSNVRGFKNQGKYGGPGQPRTKRRNTPPAVESLKERPSSVGVQKRMSKQDLTIKTSQVFRKSQHGESLKEATPKNMRANLSGVPTTNSLSHRNQGNLSFKTEILSENDVKSTNVSNLDFI
jgi:hypothetical protein